MKSLLIYILLLCIKRSPSRELINEDLEHWKEILNYQGDNKTVIKRLIKEKPEYRNLLYYRLGGIRVLSRIFQYFYKPLPTLYIWTQNIGGGLFIQHGFATVIGAEKIGKHCFINQQVTIGYNGDKAPIIGDNVTITCGAKVIGGVHIGDNCIIGANSVVVKDIPSDSTVVGVPGRIIKKNGNKCNENPG